MVSFYGNIKNSSRVSFIFDKTYSSRKKMEEGCSSDGVYNGRYILVKYGTDGKRFIPNTSETSIIEDPAYTLSAKEDWLKYAQTYDATVWQKIWSNNVEKYIMVAELNAQPPRFTTIADAPEVDNNNPHVDEYHSTITDYKIHIPQNWKMNNTVNFTYNKDGFNKAHQSVITTEDIDGNSTTATTYWITEKSGATYPVHETYIKYNDYVNSFNYKDFYILSGSKYKSASTLANYDASLDYYKYAVERAKYDADGNIIKSEQDDRKRLVFDIPAIGNMASAFWDLIYPSDASGARNTVIKNRDGSISIPDDTFAEIVNNFLALLGLETDNEYKKMLNEYPRTIWGLFNAFSDLLGSISDTVSNNKFIPVSDLGFNTLGSTSETNFNNWHNGAFGPLYYKNDAKVFVKVVEYTPGEYIRVQGQNSVLTFLEQGYTIYEKNNLGKYILLNFGAPPAELLERAEWQQNVIASLDFENKDYYGFKFTLYYRDTNSLWALLREYQELRDLYNPNWLLDYANSPAYIKNKPYVIFSDDEVVAGIDANNYYWYVYAGENDGFLTQSLYNTLKNTLYVFNEDTQLFNSASVYSNSIKYYINKNTILHPSNSSIENRWNNVNVTSPNGTLSQITSTISSLAEAITLSDIEEAIRKVENNEI